VILSRAKARRRRIQKYFRSSGWRDGSSISDKLSDREFGKYRLLDIRQSDK
jgi:hypothetical protein